MKRLAIVLVVTGWIGALGARAENWVNWRGPIQTGVSLDRNLPDRWSPDPKAKNNNLLWTQPYGGRSTPLIMNGRVYIIDDSGEGINEQERVMCFDAESGKVLWEYRFNVFFTDIVSARVGWACLAGDPETGNIYAHGVQGLFYCFDKDGHVLWSHSLTEEYGRISGYGGRVNSPIVDGDLVIMAIVNASWGDQAQGGNRFFGMDKKTGAIVWWSQPTPTIRGTYSSIPVVAVINGERLLISGTSGGDVVALKVRTGEPVWSYTIGAKSVNISPVVEGTRVFIGHGEENLDTTEQGRIVCLDAAKVNKGQPELIWKVDGITVKYVSPLVHGGRLYVCDENGRLFCMDTENGKVIWRFKYGRSSVASPVWADGKIYVGEVGARFHILKPGPKNCQEISSQFIRSLDRSTAIEINSSCAIADGRIYLMTSDAIYCIGNKDQEHQGSADPVAPMPAEAKSDPDAKPTALQIVPADVVLKPGGSTSFKVLAFDAHGQFLKELPAKWSLPAPPLPPGAKMQPPPLRGKIDDEGKLTVEKLPNQAGIVVARAEGLSGKARVRVVPPLPYKQDFEKIPVGAPPGGWINAPGKFAVAEKHGSKVLVKSANNPNPLLARARTFFGLPTLTNYTIQADVMGMRKGADMPDMGLVANRYDLLLDGNKQRLRIVSWEALPRVDKTIPWEWKPDVWYRMKLSVNVQKEKATVRGKVWPREEQEPEAWSVEFEDPTPNTEGSPGLYGYALGILEKEPGTAIYYDNVIATPNKK